MAVEYGSLKHNTKLPCLTRTRFFSLNKMVSLENHEPLSLISKSAKRAK